MHFSQDTWLTKASRQLATVEQLLCNVLMVAFSVLLITNVFARYVLNSPLFFANELAVYILIWMAFLAISIAIHNDQHVRLTMLIAILPKAAQRVCYWLTELICLAIMVTVLWYAIAWLRSPSIHYDIAITLDWPKWHFYLIVPLFCFTSIFHLVARLFDRSRASFVLANDEE